MLDESTKRLLRLRKVVMGLPSVLALGAMLFQIVNGLVCVSQFDKASYCDDYFLSVLQFFVIFVAVTITNLTTYCLANNIFRPLYQRDVNYTKKTTLQVLCLFLMFAAAIAAYIRALADHEPAGLYMVLIIVELVAVILQIVIARKYYRKILPGAFAASPVKKAKSPSGARIIVCILPVILAMSFTIPGLVSSNGFGHAIALFILLPISVMFLVFNLLCYFLADRLQDNRLHYSPVTAVMLAVLIAIIIATWIIGVIFSSSPLFVGLLLSCTALPAILQFGLARKNTV